MRLFVFEVIDEAGTWGEFRASANDREEAEAITRECLDRQLEPSGSLREGFILVLKQEQE